MWYTFVNGVNISIVTCETFAEWPVLAMCMWETEFLVGWLSALTCMIKYSIYKCKLEGLRNYSQKYNIYKHCQRTWGKIILNQQDCISDLVSFFSVPLVSTWLDWLRVLLDFSLQTFVFIHYYFKYGPLALVVLKKQIPLIEFYKW